MAKSFWEAEMFKKTSDNQQLRLARIADFGRNNEVIDPSAFKESEDPLLFDAQWKAEHDRLVDLKRQHERAIQQNNDSLEHAAIAYRRRDSSALSQAMFRSLQEKRDRLKKELWELDADIRKHNQQKREFDVNRSKLQREHKVSFDSAFHSMAKRVLAKPVYQRVLVATIHWLQEEDQSP
jgi:hypothetical protein